MRHPPSIQVTGISISKFPSSKYQYMVHTHLRQEAQYLPDPWYGLVLTTWLSPAWPRLLVCVLGWKCVLTWGQLRSRASSRCRQTMSANRPSAPLHGLDQAQLQQAVTLAGKARDKPHPLHKIFRTFLSLQNIPPRVWYLGSVVGVR